MIIDEKRIINAMNKLKIGREEALEMFHIDQEIDKGADPFPLSIEQKKVEKKMKRGESEKKMNKNKPERKKNETKSELISQIFKFLNEKYPEIAENSIILSAERQIAFDFSGEKFELTLTQKRKARN